MLHETGDQFEPEANSSDMPLFREGCSSLHVALSAHLLTLWACSEDGNVQEHEIAQGDSTAADEVPDETDSADGSLVILFGSDRYEAEYLNCSWPAAGGVEWFARMTGPPYDGEIRSGGGLQRGKTDDGVFIEFDHTVADGWEWTVDDPGVIESWWALVAASETTVLDAALDPDAGTATGEVLFGWREDRVSGSFELHCP